MLNGVDFAEAAALHKNGAVESAVRENLAALRDADVKYFRDGGDRPGVSLLARDIAGEYGVEYASCAFATHKRGLYGGIVGFAFDDAADFAQLVKRAKELRCDFIKVMYSGLVCFDSFGRISCPPMESELMAEVVRIAHGEGLRVMAHVNGADTVRAALEAGTDSIEHGYFMDEECIALLKESGAVWVPTVSAVAAFKGREGCDGAVVERTVASQLANIKAALELGAYVACGSDSGAVGVPHGAGTRAEAGWLERACGGDWPELEPRVIAASERIRQIFRAER